MQLVSAYLSLGTYLPAELCKYVTGLMKLESARMDLEERIYTGIINELTKYEFIRIDTIIGIGPPVSCKYTYTIINNGPLFIIRSAFETQHDLRQFCKYLSYYTETQGIAGPRHRILAIIIDFVIESPARVCDILHNHNIQVNSLIPECIEFDYSAESVIWALIYGDHKSELKCARKYTQYIFVCYLVRNKFSQYISELIAEIIVGKWPLLYDYFDILMSDPMPLIDSMRAAISWK